MRKQGRLKGRKHEHSGQQDNIKNLRVLNISALLILSTYNLVFYIIDDAFTVFSIINLSCFILLAFVIYSINHKLILYIIYIFIGSLTLVFAERAIEYSGMVFFIFASGLYSKPKTLLISFTIAFMMLSIRLTALSNSVPITIQMLLLFCFLSATSYLIFFKKPKRRVDLWKEISEKEKAILKLFMRGKDYARISHILNLTDKKDSIRTIITRCRTKSGCENDIQFGIWLSDKG